MTGTNDSNLVYFRVSFFFSILFQDRNIFHIPALAVIVQIHSSRTAGTRQLLHSFVVMDARHVQYTSWHNIRKWM